MTSVRTSADTRSHCDAVGVTPIKQPISRPLDGLGFDGVEARRKDVKWRVDHLPRADHFPASWSWI